MPGEGAIVGALAGGEGEKSIKSRIQPGRSATRPIVLLVDFG